jgi:hypothetical protein
MNNTRRTVVMAMALAAFILQACGGGGNSTDSGAVRLINATQTHPSLDLLASSTTVISATALDNASAYVSQAAGSITLQVNDAGSSTSRALSTSVIVKDLHYSVLAYESDGAVRLALLGEDLATPASGTAQLRVFDTAAAAGALDVYVTAPDIDLASVASPTFTISAASYAQSTGLVSLTPGSYRVRVTAADNKDDLRLDMPSVTLANQQIGTVILTPTAGASLVNGGWLLQQGAFTAARNTSARVRLAAAVSGNATVAASAGNTPIDVGVVSPSVGTYTVVPASSTLAATVNGAVLATTATLTAGTDVTLLVHGTPTAATVSALIDDNFLPATTTKLKMRLINGTTGTAIGLTLNADFGVLANNVQAGHASAPALVTANSAMRIEVTSSVNQQSLYLQTGLNIPGSGVYTMFMLGDSAAPAGVLRKDR